MKRLAFAPLAALALAGLFYAWAPATANPPRYSGMCDASGAVALDNNYFVVADDEQTVLRVYSRLQPGPPVRAVDVSSFLGLPRHHAEVDLEDGAELAGRIYWISSHGCNAAGQEQASRRRFFATVGSVNAGRIDLHPVGRPYRDLLQDLLQEPRLAAFGLAAASQRKPKGPDGLNIEGLAATPEGHLLIGFRNPIPQGKALLVPLLNPAQIIEGAARARFGDPILLDLGGLGVRSLAYHNGLYWIVAGSYDGELSPRLFEWRGGDDVPRPRTFPELSSLNPEAVTFFSEPGGELLWVLSDDGTVKVGGKDCKRLKNPRLKHFRAVGIALRPPAGGSP